MLKRTLYFLCLALMLSACAQGASTAAPMAASTTVQQTPGQSAVNQPTADSPTPARQAGCTVKTSRFEPNPTQEALLPPPGEKDWVKGPEEAYVTLIEYSDFQ